MYSTKNKKKNLTEPESGFREFRFVIGETASEASRAQKARTPIKSLFGVLSMFSYLLPNPHSYSVRLRLHRAFRNTIGAIHRHRQICRNSKFSQSVSLLPPSLVPCREFKKAVAAHHRQFSVLVTLRHPLYCVGSSWSIVLHYQGGLHCQALQSLQVSVGHLVVNHSFGFL